MTIHIGIVLNVREGRNRAVCMCRHRNENLITNSHDLVSCSFYSKEFPFTVEFIERLYYTNDKTAWKWLGLCMLYCISHRQTPHSQFSLLQCGCVTCIGDIRCKTAVARAHAFLIYTNTTTCTFKTDFGHCVYQIDENMEKISSNAPVVYSMWNQSSTNVCLFFISIVFYDTRPNRMTFCDFNVPVFAAYLYVSTDVCLCV